VITNFGLQTHLKRDRKDLGRTGDTQRLKKPELSIEDTLAQKMRGANVTPTVKPEDGYNPYDTWPSIQEPDAAKRNTDLRRLSEWMRLKRQVETLKKDDKGDKDKGKGK
jgi:hypothetical protein